MTNPQERPELRASILDAFDKWDREVRRPARRRRIATVSVGVVVAVGCLWSGVILFSGRTAPEVAISKIEPQIPPPPVVQPVAPPVEKPIPPPVRPPTSPVKKGTAPVFRGAETQRTIRLTPGVQLVQGTDIRPISGVAAPVEVNTFTVSIFGEVWRIGLSGGQPLKMVGGTSGFILPSESGPVTILFSAPVIDKGILFGTRVGKTDPGTSTITFSKEKQ